MGKGGNSHGDGEGEKNMAAWLTGINTLKIQPFELPPLGKTTLSITFIFYLGFLFPSFLVFLTSFMPYDA